MADGRRFYYADERKQDGSAKYRVDGDGHAQLFLQLAEDSTPGPWLQTFVKGVGYKRFSPVANLTGLGAV